MRAGELGVQVEGVPLGEGLCLGPVLQEEAVFPGS